MKYHDAIKDKPKKSGYYMAYFVTNYGHGDVVYNAGGVDYDAKQDTWNGHKPLYPRYWSEIPTVDELAQGCATQ